MKLQYEDMCKALAQHSFLFRLAGSDCRLRFAGLWPSGAVTRPKLLQSRKARARNWQAETRSNAVLPSKESE